MTILRTMRAASMLGADAECGDDSGAARRAAMLRSATM
jgi:hypothetical protein